MSAEVRSYKRLPGTQGALTLFARQRLWLAEDHLLQVMNFYFLERYRRFYFCDIAALLVRCTHTHAVLNLIGAIYMCGFAVAVLLVKSHGWRIALAVCLGFTLLLVLINIKRGPTCKCWIKTALGEVRLYPVTRVKGARKLIAALRPLIEQAQPPLSAAELAPPVDPDTPAPLAEAPTASVRSAARQATRNVCELTLMLLIALGLVEDVSILRNGVLLEIIGTVLYLGIGALTVVALARQRGRHLGGGVRRIFWALLGLLCAFVAVDYVHYFTILVQHPKIGGNSWLLLKYCASISGRNSRFKLVYDTVFSGAAFTLSAVGLALLRGQARRERH